MIHQFAALPYRLDEQGKLEILLITSKERRRWVIPKGNPISSFRNYETAAREAFEEAGIEGGIAPEPVGSFRYLKRRRGGADVPAMVTVFPMLVTRQLRHWPERGERQLRWFAPEEAAEAVEEPELKEIIMSLNRRKETLYPRASLVMMGAIGAVLSMVTLKAAEAAPVLLAASVAVAVRLWAPLLNVGVV